MRASIFASALRIVVLRAALCREHYTDHHCQPVGNSLRVRSRLAERCKPAGSDDLHRSELGVAQLLVRYDAKCASSAIARSSDVSIAPAVTASPA